MIEIKEVNQYRYLFAAVLTVLVFVLGVSVSGVMDSQRTSALLKNNDANVLDLESQQLQLRYLKEDAKTCETMETGLINIVRDYNARLNDLQTFRENSVMNKEDYKHIKRSYILSGIRYWMFSQDLRSRCDYGSSTVLFFTTTLDKKDCQECKTAAHELDVLKKRYGRDLLIFSVPTTMDDGMVEILSERYNVTDPPVLVLNGEKVLNGTSSRSEIKNALNLSESR